MDLKSLSLPVDRPHRLFLVNPLTGGPLAASSGERAFLDLLSAESSEARRFNDWARDRRLRERSGRAPNSDELRGEAVERMARLTKGWLLASPQDGAVLDAPCTPENARALYGEPGMAWLFEQADAFAADRIAFFAAPPSS